MLRRIRFRNAAPPHVFAILFNTWTQSTGTLDVDTAVDWQQVTRELDGGRKRGRNFKLAHYQDEDRIMLLHVVCALQPPLDVVKLLLRLNPAALHTASCSAGITPFMIACGRNAKPEVIRYLLNNSGEDDGMTRTSDFTGCFPIHWSCRSDVSVEVMKTLLFFDPQLANQKMASGTNSNSNNNSNSRRITYRTNPMTPLEMLTQENIRTDDQWKKLCYVLVCRHISGALPNRSLQTMPILHAALALQIPADALDIIVQKYADSASKMIDHRGMLPLHYAVQFQGNNAIIHRLLNSFPVGAKWKDAMGRLPLHVVIETGYRWSECVHALYEQYAAAITVVQPQSSMLPVALAARSGCVETTFALLRENPGALQMQTRT